MCDPVDYYCVKPKPEDAGIIEFYAENTGLPGPLIRAKPTWADPKAAKPTQGPAAMRHQFLEGQYLDYAYPELRQMRGSSYLRGPEIQSFNIEDFPFDRTHNRHSIGFQAGGRKVLNPHSPMPMDPGPGGVETGPPTMWTPVEKCGCGKPDKTTTSTPMP